MARFAPIALLLLAAACAAVAQDIVDNLFPKNGDVCRDAGDQWRTIKLGPCEAGTKCQGYKRGVYKCVSTKKEMGAMPLGTECYNEYKVDVKDRAESEKWRTYYRQRNCVWEGVDRQGTPLVQCIQTKEDAKIYKCGRIMPLDKTGCYTVSGSMIWGRWNDNQMYDACNGCPCTPPEKTKCKSGPCKYPLCKCNDKCDETRRKQMCPTA
ncbi:MAG: hypothetical protein J3K34DRAFT_429742 [Monoraphidium minutum]|nr:MAG: hypothetical protein J3K34DRAFT_429742 [Monoraphidium minutum]